MKQVCRIRVTLGLNGAVALFRKDASLIFLRETHPDTVAQQPRRQQGGCDAMHASKSMTSPPQRGCRCRDLRWDRVLMFNICVSLTFSFYLGNIQHLPSQEINLVALVLKHRSHVFPSAACTRVPESSRGNSNVSSVLCFSRILDIKVRHNVCILRS